MLPLNMQDATSPAGAGHAAAEMRASQPDGASPVGGSGRSAIEEREEDADEEDEPPNVQVSSCV